MSQSVPDWLDEDFLRKSLQGGVDKEEIFIKSFSINDAVPPGLANCSLLFRVDVSFEKKNNADLQNLSLIVKGPLEKASSDFCRTESTFYKDFLPAALKISPNLRFAPKTYFSPNTDVIVMQDLTREGYSMVNKRVLLDFDHCRLYIEASSTLHAVSMAVHNQYPELVESMGNEKFLSNDLLSTVGMKKMCKAGLLYMAEKMSGVEEYTRYADAIRRSPITVWDKMIEALKPNAAFNTLCQSDPWITNMMYKYNKDGTVLDIKLLDFQGLRYASPVCDLIFFIWTSANHDVRETKLEDLYRAYCDSLNAKLEEYNCPQRLPFDQLLEHVRRFSFKALGVASTSFPIFISPTFVDTSSLVFDDCDESVLKRAFDQCYDKEYNDYHLPRILKQLKAAGVLDYVEKHLTVDS